MCNCLDYKEEVMQLSPEIKLDLLKTAMIEDRTEIRLIKDRINSICTFITISSFAISSFLLGQKNETAFNISWKFFLLVDISFILLLWVLFMRLKSSLQKARKCLEAREDMIRDMGKIDADNTDKDFDPFQSIDLQSKPRLRDNSLYWIVGVATLVLLMKLVIIIISKVSPNYI